MNERRYMVLGGDGKPYGPATAAQLRDWIRQDRLDRQSLIFVEGTTEWTYAGLLPELADLFHPPSPPLPPLSPKITPAKRDNGFALWGMIWGLLAWTACGCCLPMAIIGLTLSLIGFSQINEAPERYTGRHKAIAGIVLSATNLLWAFGFTLLGLLNDGPAATWNFN